MKHLKYLSYLIRHKWFVLLAGIRLEVSFWRLITHDLSKFRPSEWSAYVEYFYGDTSPDDGKRDFDLAWNRHQNRNDHHWQYWLLTNDTRRDNYSVIPGDSDINSEGIRVMDWTPEEHQKYVREENTEKLCRGYLCEVPVGIGEGYKMLDRAHMKVDLITDAINHRPTPLCMSIEATREMVADWAGAGRAITGKWDVYDWYQENKHNMQLHPETRERVEIYLWVHFSTNNNK